MNIAIKLFLILSLISLSGCKSDSKAESKASSDTTVNDTVVKSSQKVLQLNVKTEVFLGEKYEAKSSDAKINIEHSTSTDQKFVTLTLGEGVIISK